MDPQGPAASARLRSLVGGCIGNAIEWFDFIVYSTFAVYFAPTFFPQADPTAQLLSAVAIAAVGYVMRPLGSWMMGTYADRYGRRAALALSVGLMCAGSLMIAAVPPYATIGVAAPALLLVARLLQALSMGGEYGTSATYLAEMAPPGRRGFILGFLQVSVAAGQLGAFGVLLLLQHLVLPAGVMEAWGWRLPFVLGAMLALFALYMRRGIHETESFHAAKTERNRGALSAMLTHRRAILYSVGVTVGGTVAFYTFTVYMQKFMVNTIGLSREAASIVAAAALLCYLPLQPLLGGLSDRIGRRPVLLGFAASMTLLSVPLLTVMAQTTSPWVAFACNLAGLVMLSGFTSVHMLVKAELFPAEVRALGVGLPYAMTTAVLGGTTEFVALSLRQAGHEAWFYVYVAAAAAVSLVTVLLMPETQPDRVAREARTVESRPAPLGAGLERRTR